MIVRLARALLGSRAGLDLVAATAAINALALGSSLYSIQLLNRYVSIGLTPTLVSLTVGVLIAILFEYLLRKQRQHLLSVWLRRWDHRTSERVFAAFSGARLEALQSQPLASRREALNAPLMVQQLASSNNISAVFDLPFAVMFVLVAALLYWPFGPIGLAVCTLCLIMGTLAERSQRRAADNHAKVNARAQQLGQFLLAAGESVRALPLLRTLTDRWTAIGQESLDHRRQGLDLQASLQTASQSLGQLLTVAVYAVGAMAAVQGQLSTGALIGASILLGRAFAVCSRAAYLAEPLQRASRAEAALSALEKLDQETPSGVGPAKVQGRLEINDLSFAYPSNPNPVFERLSLELPAGKVLVVFGPNGSGKTTLIRLLLGMMSGSRGAIRLDGIEIRQLSLDWRRANIAYVPQEPAFFDGTLRENLILDRAVTDDDLLVLVREMGLEHFLAHDPLGLDRPISSHDTGLAVGLRRRLALVRAVLGPARVVLMDEPTEGLDQAGQMIVAKLLNRLLSEGRTLIVASNEPFILRSADLLIDMSKKPVPLVGTTKAPAQDDPARPATPLVGAS